MSSAAASSSIAIADAVVGTGSYSWTICRSARDHDPRSSPLAKTLLSDHRNLGVVAPPSLWTEDERRRRCFLRRNDDDDSAAPGTALFQHWLSDFYDDDIANSLRRSDNNRTGESDGTGANNETREEEENDHFSFDPWNDFPTWEIMRRYPDIGEDERAREHYTLWYTTAVTPTILEDGSSTVDPTVANNFGEFTWVPNDDGGIKQDAGAKTDDGRRRRGHLTLHGANYEPVVYFDGKLMKAYSTTPKEEDDDDGRGRPEEEDAQQHGGMFLRRHYDLGVRDMAAAAKVAGDEPTASIPLEILVLPPPFVGKPTPLNSPEVDEKYGLEDGQGGDHELARSGAVMQFAAGWDWIRSTPDRNTGIWDKVEVQWIEGDVRLHDVYARVLEISVEGGTERDSTGASSAALPLGDDDSVTARIELSLAATRHESERGGRDVVKGEFRYWIVPSSTSDLEPSNILAAGTVRNVTIRDSAVEVNLGNVTLPGVRLWWPHSHSSRRRQPLYAVHVAFRPYDGEGAARARTNFGVRTVSSFVHPRTKSFALRVNGHPVFLAGGNWIATDQFLRHSNSPRRYRRELSLLRHAGLNAVRVWGGGVAETRHFYDAADELGLMVYQEFWMTGDNNGNFAGSHDWPADHGAYLANARDTIKRLRNHPSLCFYGGGNELHPIPSSDASSGTSPPRDIDEGLRRHIADLDGRPYVTSSVTAVGGDDTFDASRTLAPADGPYGILSEDLFFDRNPGLASPLLTDGEIERNATSSDVADDDKNLPGRNIGFQTEVGSVSHPELESLQRFLSPDALHAYPDCGEKSVHGGSVHEEWAYFKYLPFTDSGGVDHICQFKHSPSGTTAKHRMESIEDYSWAAQFAQYLQLKSLVEGYTHRMWEWYSAAFFWKAQSPAPAFRGALYDWYLAQNGGYWGARAGSAGGRPVRVVLNLRDWTVHVINTVPMTVSATSVKWSAHSLEGKLLANGEVQIPTGRIDGNSVVHIAGSLEWVGGSESSASNLRRGPRDVVLYRLDLSHEDDDDGVGAGIAKNEYYLTDPSIGGGHARFSSLGAIRKETPRVDLDVRCTLLSSIGIECALENARDNGVAIMAKLALVKSIPDNLGREGEDRRLLPTLFSDNYLTVLPGETSRVHLSTDSIELLERSERWICAPDGFVRLSGEGADDFLMLSVGGWNVQEGEVRISCSVGSSTKWTSVDAQKL